MEIEKKEYGTYVKEITPVHSTVKNMLRAFLAGGAVCTIGQDNLISSKSTSSKSSSTNFCNSFLNK